MEKKKHPYCASLESGTEYTAQRKKINQTNNEAITLNSWGRKFPDECNKPDTGQASIS